MSRITRHHMYMEIAGVFARRSTCMRLNVGAVIVDPIRKRIVSHGYNGPPAGESHCTGHGCADPAVGCLRAVHAEMNAITRIGPLDINRTVTLYVTDSPCPDCLMRLTITPTITTLFYRQAYRIPMNLDGLENLRVYRLTPSGYVIDHRTQELVDGEGI